MSREDINTTWAFVGDQGDNLRIDDYTVDKNDPTHIKIDVEGAEGEVITGMIETINRSHPTLYIELHPSKIRSFGLEVEDVIQMLQDLGYKLSIMKHKKAAKETREKWREVTVSSNISENPDHILKAFV